MSAAAEDAATRRAYDAVAGEYARLLPDLSAEAPADRDLLAAFAADVGAGLVADVGCGTGRVAAHLTDAGLRVLGLDLSPGMLAAARPGLLRAAASVQALPLRSGCLDGALAWYSLVHLHPGRLPQAAAELARVLRPGAPLLVAFQSGTGERVDRASAYRPDVRMTSYRHDVEVVTAALEGAGLVLEAATTRPAERPHEGTPQAFLSARRSAQLLANTGGARTATSSTCSVIG